MLPDFERNDSEQQDNNIALVQQREDEDIAMIIDTAVQPTPKVISARPIFSSSSNIMDPVAGPSTSRLPASILPHTLYTPNVDESSEQWVLGRTHYHDAQVTVDHSLSCIIEDDAPRFVSDIQHL